MGHKKTFASKPKRPMPKLHDRYRANARVIVATGDCVELMKSIPDNSIRLIITSPPYNVDKEYEKRVALEEYLNSLRPIISEINRVLRFDGSICWQVGNYVKNRELFPLDWYHYDLFREHNYKLRNRIVWHYGHGLHSENRFSGRYEMLLWLTKSDTYVFNLDSVRVPAKYPGKRHHKGEKKGQPSGNPEGKNPSDVWEIIAQEWQDGFWNIPNVKAHHAEKTEHPCQFPIEVAERCILALSNENEWVLDPFSGVGSSLLAGLMHERRVIGFEREDRYVTIAKDRINALFKDLLPYRPMGKPVYQPTGKERVAKLPEEWIEGNGHLSDRPQELIVIEKNTLMTNQTHENQLSSRSNGYRYDIEEIAALNSVD